MTSTLRATLTTLVCFAACATAAAEAATERPDYKRLVYPPAPEFSPANPERHELANGMVVYVLPDHEFPVVSISVAIHTGSIYEPEDKLGLAGLTGELMRLGGTTTLAPEELDRRLEDMASNVATSIDDNQGTAAAWSLVENLDATCAMLADVLRRPRFDADKLDLLARQARTAIQARNDEASAVADREFGRLVYGRSYPFARVVELEHIARITRDDVVAFHARFYQPNNMILGIVGDISAEAALEMARKHFGDWETSEVSLPPLPEPQPSAPGVYYADLASKGVTQTAIRVGHLGIRRDHPDYPKILLMNYILGGGGFGTSRLLNQVRTKQGLAYGVWSSFRGQYDRPGAFFAGCDTKAETTVQAIESIIAEIERIRREEVSIEELSSARDEILKAEVFNYDSPAEILSRTVTYEYFGYPQDLLEKTLRALSEVTPADIKHVASTFIDPARLVILAAGDKSKFKVSITSGDGSVRELGKPLEALERGAVTTLDISIPVGAQTRTEVLDFADPAARARAKELAAKVIEGAGGTELLANIKTQKTQVTLTPKAAPPGTPPLRGKQFLVAPDRARFELEIMGMQMVMVAQPEGAWRKQGPSIMDMSPDESASLVEEAAALANNPWLRIVAGELEAAAGGTAKEDGIDAVIVGVKDDDNPTVYHVDPATGDVLRRITTKDGARTETVYRSFEVMEGRRIARDRSQIVNGDEIMAIRLESLEINPEIDPALFVRPGN